MVFLRFFAIFRVGGQYPATSPRAAMCCITAFILLPAPFSHKTDRPAFFTNRELQTCRKGGKVPYVRRLAFMTDKEEMGATYCRDLAQLRKIQSTPDAVKTSPSK